MRGTSTTIRATTATSTRTTTPKRRSDRPLAARALLALAAWALFAFAGVYRWTTFPLAIGVLILAALARPRIAARGCRGFDLALLASALAIAVQLIPLGANLRLVVAPSSIAYEQAVRIAPGGAAPVLAGPITVNADATRFALFLVGLTLVAFWSARTLLERGGVRRTIRGVAWLGIIVAPLGIAQHVTAPRFFYWHWIGATSNTLPYTPFINRNDFAGWLATAIPLTLGYAVGRMQSRRLAGEPFDPEVALDNHGVLLATSAFAMTAALLASLSRSAMAGAAAGLLLFVTLSRSRMSRRRTMWMLIGLAAMIGAAAMYANMDLLASRLGGAMSEGMIGRVAIWRQTWPMVRDFWPVGSGAGTYQQVMVLYQTSSRLFYISHADDEYLQILAEGGALLAVPVAIAIALGVAAVVRRLRDDRTSLFWTRAGAVSGILALAVQNVFEMTLRVPANAILLAIVAAIALRENAR